jgi:hypothetical protein
MTASKAIQGELVQLTLDGGKHFGGLGADLLDHHLEHRRVRLHHL